MVTEPEATCGDDCVGVLVSELQGSGEALTLGEVVTPAKDPEKLLETVGCAEHEIVSEWSRVKATVAVLVEDAVCVLDDSDLVSDSERWGARVSDADRGCVTERLDGVKAGDSDEVQVTGEGLVLSENVRLFVCDTVA
jgi:hypothetical protein